MKFYNIPIFIPQQACDYTCVFCNQKKITGQAEFPTEEEIHIKINQYLSTIKHDSHVEIAFFGGSFTANPISIQEKYLKMIQKYIKLNQIQGIRISTRPDSIKQNILDLLKKYNVKTIELGIQSMNDNVLKRSGRKHSLKDSLLSSKLIKKNGFQLGLQMMIGLPESTFDIELDTAKKIVDMKADFARIYPTLVFKNTELEGMFLNKKYSPLTLDETISRLKHLLILFEKNNIPVIRIGLHPSDELLNNDALVAGPFHVSLRELVETQIFRDILVQKVDLNRKANEIEIEVPQNQINYAIGYHAKNKNFLKQFFVKVKFLPSNLLKNRMINVFYH